MKTALFFVIFILLTTVSMLSQSYPEVYTLTNADYSLTEMSPEINAGQYPQNIIFHQSSKIDPGIEEDMDSDWVFAYNLTSKSRINGLDSLGIQFYNTGSKQSGGGGYLGAAVLAINTLDVKNIMVKWTGGTVDFSSSSTREYRIRLQYKIGSEGPFYNISDNEGNPSEYIFDYSQEEGHYSELVAMLPDSCENRDTVYLRWKYYQYKDGSGGRPKLRLDDIFVSSEPVSSILAREEKEDCIFSFPNPVRDILNINIIDEAYGQYEIYIYSLPDGKLKKMISRKLPEQINFSTMSLSSGIYLIILKNHFNIHHFNVIYKP